MGISTLESRDSIVMLDAMEAESEAIEQARHVYQQQLLDSAKGDLRAPCAWYGIKRDYATNTSRLYTVREALADLARDSSNEATVEDLIGLVVDAAAGKDTQARAHNFMLRLANYYADQKVGEL